MKNKSTFKKIMAAETKKYTDLGLGGFDWRLTQTTMCNACGSTGRKSNMNKGPKDCTKCGGSGLIKGNRV
jgi:DnaJ-class molecular chaperone